MHFSSLRFSPCFYFSGAQNHFNVKNIEKKPKTQTIFSTFFYNISDYESGPILVSVTRQLLRQHFLQQQKQQKQKQGSEKSVFVTFSSLYASNNYWVGICVDTCFSFLCCNMKLIF